MTGTSSTATWANLVVGGMGYPGKKMELYGQFKNGAALSGDSDIKTLVNMGYGNTLSIKNLSCFGIFELLHGGLNNTYSNPSGDTAWRMDMASTGQFGGNTASYGTYMDFGLWMASINDGNLSNPNKLSGTLTGEFLTYRKQGTLSGTLLGNLLPATATTGSWQGATVGAWEKTRDVAFSSGITGSSYNLSKSSNGSDANSNYWESEHLDGSSRSASSYTNLSGSPVTYTQYDVNGPPDQPQYSKTVWNMTSGTPAYYTLQEAKTMTSADYNSAIDALILAMPNRTDGYSLNWSSGHDGVFAGFGNLWNNMGSGQTTEIALMGQYGGDIATKPTLFGSAIVSFNPLVNMIPFSNSQSPIGGAYYGYLGAAFGKNVVTADWLDGMVNGLYYDPAGNVGVFTGTFTGTNNPNIAAWKAAGLITGGYPLGTGNTTGDFILNATNFASNVVFSNWNQNYGINDVAVTGDDVKLRVEQRRLAAVYSEFLTTGSGTWGVWQSITGGTYSGTPTAWRSEYDISQDYGRQTQYKAVQITGTDKGITTGIDVGAWVNIPSPSTGNSMYPYTGVAAGTIKGLFDPNTATWQAVSQGVSMETSTFLGKVNAMNDAQRLAFQKATNIPAFQVGQATLSSNGYQTVPGGSMSVTMSNVTFFSSSTGGTPAIWATNDVRGNYSGTPSTSGPAVNLSGSGLKATFGINSWDAVNNNWAAKVASSNDSLLSGGSYSGSVNFKGGAAGKIQTEGYFSGTGAGIAK